MGLFGFFVVNLVRLRFNKYVYFGDFFRIQEKVMAAFSTTILICLLSMAWFSGCSSDEKPQSPLPPPKIVKPIAKPAPKDPVSPLSQDEGKGGIETRTSLTIETASKTRPGLPTAQKQKAPQEEGGYHTVRNGESLASIAGLQGTYRDPLKWPLIFRTNLDKLENLSAGEDLPGTPLPEGMRLRIVTPEEAKKNVQNRTGHDWVINVLSSTSEEEIALAAVVLAKKGYPIYITQGQVKGREWMRLRVGFFESKRDAEALGKKIQELLNLGDPWITKADQEEFREFGGLLIP
jgi:hypothetical protein